MGFYSGERFPYGSFMLCGSRMCFAAAGCLWTFSERYSNIVKVLMENEIRTERQQGGQEMRMRQSRNRKSAQGPEGGSVIAAICFTLFLFSFAAVLILNFRWLYYLDITLLKLDIASGMNTAAVRANYDALIDYNQLWFRGALRFPTLPMSARGEQHFREVKQIFDLVQVLFLVTGAAGLYYWFKRKKRYDPRCLTLAGALCILAPAGLGVFAAAGWNRFFVLFHRLAFRNDYWLFDPATDPVIRILPDTFFLQCAGGILLVMLMGGAGLLLLARRRAA